ncbi:MAG: phosphodiester glycosidase family protein [Erythrobacter sp.]|uniref:phosphodiester glycosidase family protein n=1 Tax=Erythrobacter sp. TaxID=1042 RepID=UPI0025E0C507|nr:phosphodiester glycosidase family protein [Erythrobacter sp.]MCL9999880.1 phosphodiester glycosidase family protein [Erythrobacter sp.]
MTRVALALAVTLLLAACSEAPAGEALVTVKFDGSDAEEPLATPTETAAPDLGPSACESVTFESVPLTHCIADPAQHRIAMANLGADKQPFGSLAAFAASVDPAAIAFAINGGMYGDDLKAIGYYVQKGERLKELNRAGGEGNFYMKPNGVFFGSDAKWQVLGSNTFFNTVGDRPQFGTQSGPLLLVDGKLHPEVQDDGPSKAIRNAVGVDAAGKAHFVISDAPVSFGQLARYFRDVLKVKNALYLDGAISSLWDPARSRMDKGRVGPIIVVSKREAKP